MIHTTLEERVKIHLEVNDYIKTKDEKLFDFIATQIAQAKQTKSSIELPFFTSYERKKIHSYVTDLNDPHINTESRWEWKLRRMHIIASSEKPSLDINRDHI